MPRSRSPPPRWPMRSRGTRAPAWKPRSGSSRASGLAAQETRPPRTRRRCRTTAKRGRASPLSWLARRASEVAMLIVGTRTLKSALEDKAGRFPDRPFLLFEDTSGDTGCWTWREFDRTVNRAAHLLLRHGLRHGDTFNLHLGNCPEFLFFWMAAAKTGTVMVPTNPASTADEMAYILTHSEARLSITESQYAATVRAGSARASAPPTVIECRRALSALADMPDRAPDQTVASSDLLSMQYTSGTTSRPKGVLLTHANYLYGGEVMSKAMRVGPEDRHLVV